MKYVWNSFAKLSAILFIFIIPFKKCAVCDNVHHYLHSIILIHLFYSYLTL